MGLIISLAGKAEASFNHSTVNGALPGKHWVVPQFHEIEECVKERENAPDEEGKKKVVLKFLKKEIQPNKADNTLLIIGLATAPAAMAAKKAGESVPQLKLIRRVPDVVFVPAATLLALVSVKTTRILLLQCAASEDRLVAKNHQGNSDRLVAKNHQGTSNSDRLVAKNHQGTSNSDRLVAKNHQGTSNSDRLVAKNHQGTSDSG